MGGQTSKSSFGMKERSAPALQGERVVKYRLHRKYAVGEWERGLEEQCFF